MRAKQVISKLRGRLAEKETDLDVTQLLAAEGGLGSCRLCTTYFGRADATACVFSVQTCAFTECTSWQDTGTQAPASLHGSLHIACAR